MKPQDHMMDKNTTAKRKLIARVKRQDERHHKLMELSWKYGWRCWYCGIPIDARSNIAPHIDHIIPKSNGGSDDYDNRALTCEFCNKAKGTRSLEEFLDWLEWIKSSSETFYKAA